MTSEANRAYVMETVDSMMASYTETEVDNNDVLKNSTTEDKARAEIEASLNVKLPQFYYIPDGMTYLEYSVDKESEIGILQYLYENKVIRLMVLTNEKNATSAVYRDTGNVIDNITSDLCSGLSVTLWEIYEQDDVLPTYVLQWEYKNAYYELIGKLPEEEMENIAKEIMY